MQPKPNAPIGVKHLFLRPRQITVGGNLLMFARVKERPRHCRRLGRRRIRLSGLMLMLVVRILRLLLVLLLFLWLLELLMLLMMRGRRLVSIVRCALGGALIRGRRVKHTVARHRANRGGQIARVRLEHARECVGVDEREERRQRVSLERLIAGRIHCRGGR